MKHINTEHAPQFPKLLSQGVAAEAGRLLFVAGQVGIIPDSNPPRLETTAAGQTARAMEHIRNIVEAAGGNLGHLAMVRIAHTRAEDYADINAAYLAALPGEEGERDLPARIATGAAFLPLNALVEIEAIAELPATE